jgi:hypothetical protein
MCRCRDDDDRLDYQGRWHARPYRNVAPRGGQGGGLIASLCITQVVPGYRGTQRCTRDYPFTASLIFSNHWSWLSRSAICRYLNIDTPMDEVVVACPLAHNNNDCCSWAIYVRAIVDPGGDATQACSSSSNKLMVQVSTVCHHLQDVMPPQMLQSGWCRPCSLPSIYCPHHHILSGQSSSNFF